MSDAAAYDSFDSPPLAEPVPTSSPLLQRSPLVPRPSSPPLLPIPTGSTSTSPNACTSPTASHLAPPPSYASLTTPLLPSLPSHPRPASQPTHVAFEHSHSDLALPSGFFLLRNKAQNKTLDARGRGTHEGAEICAHPVKQPTLKGSSNSLINQYNNQVLFLDFDGHLHFANSSRPVDCIDGQLLLAHPHPIRAIPSRDSHPLPRLALDAQTGVLRVLHSCDPSFPGPGNANPSWPDDEYVVEVVPRRKTSGAPALVWAAASSGLAAAGSNLAAAGTGLASASTGLLNGIGERFGGLFGSKSEPPALPSKGGESALDAAMASSSNSTSPNPHRSPPLPPVPFSQVGERRYGDEDDSDEDDEPDAYRPVRVVKLPASWREKFPEALLSRPNRSTLGLEPSQAKLLRVWKRRQWEVVPVVVRPLPAPPGEQVPNPDLHTNRPLPPVLNGSNRAAAPSPLRLRSDIQGSPNNASVAMSSSWSASNLVGSAAEAAGGLLHAATDRAFGRGLGSPPLPRLPGEPEREHPSDLMSRLELDESAEEGTNSEFTPPLTGLSWADATVLPSETIARWAAERRGSQATTAATSSPRMGMEEDESGASPGPGPVSMLRSSSAGAGAVGLGVSSPLVQSEPLLSEHIQVSEESLKRDEEEHSEKDVVREQGGEDGMLDTEERVAELA